MTQESTEDLTTEIIKNWNEIMTLLKRDNIEIQTNEEKEIELGFKTKKCARNFVKVTSRLSIVYREDKTRYSMQLIADILKRLSNENKISKND